MVTEGSLACSQEHIIGSFPETNESSQQPPTLFL